MSKILTRDFELVGKAKITKNGTTIIDGDGVYTGQVTPSNTFSRTYLSTDAGSKCYSFVTSDIGTTGNMDFFFLAPETGSLLSVDINTTGPLSTSDTNYITFTVTNLGQSGAGSAAMLQAADTNTTKATGGSALSSNTKRTLTTTTTTADKAVVQGDLLRFRAAVTGTLGGAVNSPRLLVRFSGTT